MKRRRGGSPRLVMITIAACLAVPLHAMSPADGRRASELYQQKDWNGLASLAGRAARSDSKDGWAWYYLGLANDGLGKRDEAASAYENSMNLVPQYLRVSVVQLLAQDYATLHQTAKMQALVQQMQKSDPNQARSLQAQFRDVLGAPAAPAAVVPEVSPRTLAAMTASAQRTWRRDAIPVMVNVRGIGQGYQVVFGFYSPSNKTGFQIVQVLGGTHSSPVANPNWGVEAIPATFLPLDAAIARAPGEGAPGTLAQGVLYRLGGSGDVAIDLNWDLGMKSDAVRGVSIAAFILPREKFDLLLASARKGDANAQVLLAEVYATGLAGPPDWNQAFQWCSESAAHGNLEAQNLLGQMYEKGRGTPADQALALHWYETAANRGYAPAEYNLGLMYESGRGVGRNYNLAQQWIAKAAKQGLGPAVSELPYVSAQARGEQRQAEAAAAQRPPMNCLSTEIYNPWAKKCVISWTRYRVGNHYAWGPP